MKGKKQIDWQEVKSRLRKSQEAMDRTLSLDEERTESVLRLRTARLAGRRGQATAPATALPVLVFGLGAERYGIELADLAEALPFAHCTPVPAAPPELLGVINIRGEIRSVVDLGRLLGLPQAEQQEPDPALALQARGYVLLLRHEGREVGVRVDQIDKVQRLALEQLAIPSEGGGDLPVHYLKGRSPDRVLVLDTQALFAHSVFAGRSL